MTFAEQQVHGSSGCNLYSGTYTTDGSAIELRAFAATEGACEAEQDQGREDAFLDALVTIETYSVLGDRLELRDDTGAARLVFEPGLQAPRP